MVNRFHVDWFAVDFADAQVGESPGDLFFSSVTVETDLFVRWKFDGDVSWGYGCLKLSTFHAATASL